MTQEANKDEKPMLPGGWLGSTANYETAAGPPNFSISDVRSRVGMPMAEVKGSADLNVNVTVEPSESFLSRITSAIRNDINVFTGAIGTGGSTGPSMPQVQPNP